jgi:hypothetical protein
VLLIDLKMAVNEMKFLLKISVHVQKAFAVETQLAEGITAINLVSTRELTWSFLKDGTTAVCFHANGNASHVALNLKVQPAME